MLSALPILGVLLLVGIQWRANMAIEVDELRQAVGFFKTGQEDRHTAKSVAREPAPAPATRNPAHRLLGNPARKIAPRRAGTAMAEARDVSEF